MPTDFESLPGHLLAWYLEFARYSPLLDAALCLFLGGWIVARVLRWRGPRPARPPAAAPAVSFQNGRAGRALRVSGPSALGGRYQFSVEPAGGAWRAYILEQPPYRGRADDAHTTHRLSDGGRHYVCWSQSLATAEAAASVARIWAQRTDRYIATGKSFEEA